MPIHAKTPTPLAVQSGGKFLAGSIAAALLILASNGLLSYWNLHQVTENDGILAVTVGIATTVGIALVVLLSLFTIRDRRQRQRYAATLARAVRRKDEALALLDTLLDTAPVGIAFLDREYRYVRINEALAAINGMSVADHIGRLVPDIVPQLWPHLEPSYRSVLETGQPIFDMEIQGETAGSPGQLRHWLVSYYPVRLGGETIMGIGAVVVDVTERNRAEERLRRSEQQWRQLADAMPQIVWTARPDGYLDYYNRRWYEFTGIAEMTGGDDSWKPIVHTDDLPLAFATWYHAVHTGQTYQIECRLRDKTTGAYRWHLGRACPVRDEDGRIVRWYGTCTDIDDQKRAEEEVLRLNENLEHRVSERTEQLAASNLQLEEENRERRRAEEERGRLANEFRLLLDSSGEGIYGIDNQGSCTFINRVAAQLLGGTPEAFHGRDMIEIVHSRPREGTTSLVHDNPIYQAIRVGFACRVSDAVFRRLDGTSFPVEYSSRPLLDGGTPRGAVVTFTNITERKRREHELREAKEAAEAANRAKSEFLANMSHEIRTPMNGILGMTELALETDLQPDQREYLTAVKYSADGLMKVVNDILDFSKIEAGKLDLNPEPFRLREALDQLLKPKFVRAQKKGLELACHVAPDVPEQFIGDWNRLRQILVNLLGNALKFTHQGKVTLSVSVPRPVEQGQGPTLVLFSVCDTGIGVPADKLDTIFDPFVQADGSMARQYGGTGLGLAIVTRLTHMLGGHIWAESDVNKGSTFHFTVQLDIPTASPALPAKDETPESQEPALAPLRILLAEDNRVNQRVGVALLTKRGHTVEVANNGKLALAVLAERSFDVVLMDVQMPEMDGFEATARIRQREQDTGRRTPIIALTAHAMEGDRERCLSAGMDAYVSKPLHTASLMIAIRDVLSVVPAHQG